MRTTIRLDDALFTEPKKLAAESGRTLTAVIEDSLRQSLTRRRTSTRERVELPVFHGTGLQPGVDLYDSAALLELMEQGDASS